MLAPQTDIHEKTGDFGWIREPTFKKMTQKPSKYLKEKAKFFTQSQVDQAEITPDENTLFAMLTKDEDQDPLITEHKQRLDRQERV